MDFLFNDQVEKLIKYIPRMLYHILVSLFEWIVPGEWYAKDVSNDVVLITGAGSGLGRAIAMEYAKQGSSLVLWDINKSGLDDTKLLVDKAHSDWMKHRENLTNNCKPDQQVKFCLCYVVDVCNKSQVNETSKRVYKEINEIPSNEERYVSVLVNNAGIYNGKLLLDLTDEQIERVFNINMLSHFWTVRAFLPNMKTHRKGHIVEVASMGGICGLFKQVDYCSSKFATVGFEESLNIELDYLGLSDYIHTTVICPFFFSSNLFSGFDARYSNTLMSSEYVAKEAVTAMRCNHSRLLLPRISGYIMQYMKSVFPRKVMIDLNRVLGFDERIKDIKGHAGLTNQC